MGKFFLKIYQFHNCHMDQSPLLVYLVLFRLHYVKVSQSLYFQAISNLCLYQTKKIII